MSWHKTVRSCLSGSLVIAACLLTDLYAATDGVIGNQTSGVTTLSVAIPELIRISGLVDFNLGTYSGTGNINRNDNIRIAGNDRSSAPTYRVTAFGTGASSAFSIASGTNTINYRVFFNDKTGTGGAAEMTSGSPLIGRTGIHKSLSTTSNNGNYRIHIAESVLRNAPAGTYSGVLTLVVEPE
jgi:hypothetical protein